jgi:FlaA1/EpsC-like NDP-sugar epimerase
MISREAFQSLMSTLAPPVLALPRPAKRAVVVMLDISLCVLSVWLAYYLRLGEFISFSQHARWGPGATIAAAASVGFAVPIFIVSGLYRAIFRYSGWPALLAVTRAISIYGLVFTSVFTAVGVPGVPRTVGLIQPILLLLLVGFSRAFARLWLGEQYMGAVRRAARPKVLIYGAGQSGRQLAAAMANSQEMQVVGFLDDDERLHGHILNGLPIYNPMDLESLVSTLGIGSVLLAMPSMGRARRKEMLNQIRSAHVSVRTLPSVTDLAQGRVNVSDLRELDIDDLLGRDTVSPNHILLTRNVSAKIVLVTGAGGSIGRELCRQIVSLQPAKLLLVEQSEFALYSVHQALEGMRSGQETEVVPLLASVQDSDRLHEIMSTWHPDTIYHAAAYKHVPLVEHNPAAGVMNNVFGTLRTAQAALENHVSDFVLVSTDKAVRPTNVMGASKRLAEMALQALADQSTGTRFSMVRFGNVLGSSGSVAPKFRQQIRNSGPITLTHPEVTRYFMTIPEAAQLVIQAGAMAKGGDVFLLDMGQPVKIMDLAHRMVELSGLTIKNAENPGGDIEILLTGLRPGEKLYEELLIGDNPCPTNHPKIMKAEEDFLEWSILEERLLALEMAVNVNDVGLIRRMLQELVAGYVPSEDIVDWVYLEQESETVVEKFND